MYASLPINPDVTIKKTSYYIPPHSKIRVAWQCPYCGLTDYKEIFAHNKEFKHMCVGQCKKEYIVTCNSDSIPYFKVKK